MARPRSFEESKVINAIRDAFWNTGYAATSMDDLMAATGLGKGSLYGAFGDKHQLFLRVVDDYCTDTVERVRQALAGDDAGARERLRTLLHSVVTELVTDPKHRGCLLAKGTTELAGQDPALCAVALQTYRVMEDVLVACIEQARHHGDIASNADDHQLAGLLLAVLRGLDVLCKTGVDEASLRGIVEAAFSAL